MYRIFLLLALLFLSFPSFAQTLVNNEMGGWLMFFNRTTFHEKWSLHTEIQDRYYNLASKGEQLLIRGGLNYHYTSKLWFTGGYGFIETYPVDDLAGNKVVEHRTWQQALYLHSVGRFVLEHRGRLEQRFIGPNYRDRLRYRIMIFLPLNNEMMQPHTLFVAVYNEIFIHHFEESPYDRNRFYTALGYQFTKGTNLQTGWMAQNFKGKTKGYLQLTLTSNLNLLGK
jgi:hypothetical protein